MVECFVVSVLSPIERRARVFDEFRAKSWTNLIEIGRDVFDSISSQVRSVCFDRDLVFSDEFQAEIGRIEFFLDQFSSRGWSGCFFLDEFRAEVGRVVFFSINSSRDRRDRCFSMNFEPRLVKWFFFADEFRAGIGKTFFVSISSQGGSRIFGVL